MTGLNYLITGGSGLLGSAWIRSQAHSGANITLLTRNIAKTRQRVPAPDGVSLSYVEGLPLETSSLNFDYVINLAGEPIVDKAWSVRQKRILWQSRVEFTDRLVEWMSKLESPPKALFSGSAVGWYGDGADQKLTEHSPPQSDFGHELCNAWEKSALKSVALGTRVYILRTGLVISAKGGFLSKLLPQFKLGLGGRVGTGEQYMSWVHIDDWVGGLNFLIAQEQTNPTGMEGIYNLSSPSPVTNLCFAQTLSKILNRPCIMRYPALLFRWLLGERAQMLLTGQRVLPERLLQQGFQFQYPELDQALRSL